MKFLTKKEIESIKTFGQLRETEMRQDKEDKADEQQCEGQGHGTMDLHGRDPHYKCVYGPNKQEPAHIGSTGMVNIKMVEHKDDSQGYPETTVGYKGAVAEVITAFELLETGDHLGQAAEHKAERHNGPDIAQADIVHLQQHGGESKSGKADNGRIPLNCFSIRHEKTSSYK